MTEAEPPAEAAPGAAEPPDLTRLHPAAVTLWRLGYALQGAVFILAALAAEALFGPPLPTGTLAAIIAIIAVLVVVWVPPARYRAWGYRLRATDLYLRYGILVRTTSIIPHARIQHVDTRHGPVDRALGLADVVVFTAGTRGAIIAVPALAADTAEALRDRLVALSGAGDAV